LSLDIMLFSEGIFMCKQDLNVHIKGIMRKEG